MIAAFDADPGRTRTQQPGMRILPMSKMKELISARQVKMALLTVPANVAQEVANNLIEAGILAILNFAPIVSAGAG